jgi:DNA-binding CsgD family transcriptional regulator
VTADQLARASTAVERACLDASSVVALCRSVHAAVAPVVPADRWCGFAVDPATLFATNGYHDEGVDLELLPRLLELEYGSVDAAHVSDLVRSSGGVVTISEATDGDPASSARWRDVLVPSGLAHEMRAVFRDGRNAWGALVLLRGPDVPDFSADDVAFVRKVAPTIAAGFRRVLVRQHVDHGDDAREAGIVVLSGEPLEILTATNAARFWLDQLDDGAGALPTAIASVARAARTKPVATAVRARTRNGRWLTVTADLTDDERDGHRDVGVVVQPSRPAEIAQIVGGAHGLTARETDVVLLIASGLTNQEIARQLALSPHTVADHLKSVFTKLDVPTRGALTSKLFHDYYLPRVSIDRRAGTDGWFLPD